jgi:hypothetical protein
VAFAGDDHTCVQKVAIAAALHDIGIWTDRTFDYLEPSIAVASAYLSAAGKAAWTREISAMILEHHKISPFRADPHSLVEPFRRADWVDVSRGLITFGLPRRTRGAIFSMWPDLGFRRPLVELSLPAPANTSVVTASDREAMS